MTMKIRNHVVPCGTQSIGPIAEKDGMIFSGNRFQFTEFKVLFPTFNEVYSEEVCCHMCGRRFHGTRVPPHTVPVETTQWRDAHNAWDGLISIPSFQVRFIQEKDKRAAEEFFSRKRKEAMA